MPDMTLFLSALRGAHKARYYITPLLGDLVYSATVSSATTTAIAITGGSGTIGNVARGFRVAILTSGGEYKGAVSVRYNGSITTGSIPIRETSAGSVPIVAGDLVRIYNMLVLADKLVESSADFNPDGVSVSTETSAQRPRVCSGGWDVGRLSSGSYVVYLKGGDSAVVDSTSSTVTHLWATTGGTLSSTSASEPTLTISAAGYYLVTHTVTDDDNSQTQVQYVPIYVHDENNLPYECLITSVDGDPASGFRASFELFENATIADLPDGCAVVVWAEDTLNGVGRAYGAKVDERSHILMSGFLRRDTSRASGDTGLEQVEFEVISPLAKLGELPGFSKVMVNDASPDAWSKTYDLGVFRAIMQLLTHYTNVLNMFDLSFTLFTDYDYPAFYLNKSTPLDQVKELADAVDCRLVCDRGGHFEIQRRLELLPLADRGTPVTTITMTTQDVIDYECTREHYRPVETYRARGILQGHQMNTPLFARWPATPSTGNQSPVIDKLIAESAADLQERTALRGAYEDRVYFDTDGVQHHAPTLRLTLFGAYARIFQFYAEWIAFSGITTMRGVNLADFLWILQSVSENFENGTAVTVVTLQAATNSGGAYAVDDTPATESSPVTTSPAVTYPPILTTSPGVDNDGLTATTDTLAVFDSGGNSVHIVTGFRSVLTGGTPTSVEHNLSLTGTLAAFVYTAGTSVNGIVATTEQVRTISDVFGSRTLGTAQSFTATSVSQVQLQGERGDPDNAILMRYHDTGGTLGYYTIDAGGTWTASTGLTAFYDTNYTNTAGNWANGAYVSPNGSGEIITSCHTSTGSPPGSAFYRSTDKGATFSSYAPSGWTIDGYNARCIVRPLNRSSDVVFFGSLTAGNNRLIRIIGSTRTDISPTVSGVTYGVYVINAQRSVSIADDDANALVLIGQNNSSGSGKWSILQTFNALASTPTWNTIVAESANVGGAPTWRGSYYVNRTTIYLFGTSGALGIALYSGGAWTVYSTTLSGCGNIVGICGE